MVTMITALPMSIPATRSQNSGSSSTSSTMNSYAGNAVKRSWPSAGAVGKRKSGPRARSTNSRPSKQLPASDWWPGSGPPRINDVSGRPRPILPPPRARRSRFRPRSCPITAPCARQHTPATYGGPAPRTFSRHTASPGHPRLVANSGSAPRGCCRCRRQLRVSLTSLTTTKTANPSISRLTRMAMTAVLSLSISARPGPRSHMKWPCQAFAVSVPGSYRYLLACPGSPGGCGGVPVWPRGLDRCQVTRAVPGVRGRAALAQRRRRRP